MTTNIVFDHRGRAKGGKMGYVEIRISAGNKVIYISTGVKVLPKNFRFGEVVGQADCVELNKRVRMIQRKTEDVVTELIREGAALDGMTVRRRVFSLVEDETGGGTGMFDWLQAQVKRLQLKEGTMKHYNTLIVRLRQFGGLMAWRDLSVDSICQFDEWLHEQPATLTEGQRMRGVGEHNLSDSAVYSYHKCLKALLNRAVLFGVLQQNPYDRLRGQFKRGENDKIEYLTQAEMEAVESLHPVAGTMMAKARDLFVFQMHTGLSFADTQAFDFSHYKLLNGKWVDIGNREKNGVQYVTQLSDECLRILGRYDMKLPKIDNSDYNHALKALGMAVGISKPLHSHMARHSFATLMVASGAKIENVSKMLGHTNITQTQRYAEILPESVLADFDKVRRK